MDFRTAIAMVLLTVSIFLVFDKLFSPQPIQVVSETGEEITTIGGDYFQLPEVLLLIVSSFLVGATSVYLFYHAEPKKLFAQLKPEPDKYAHIINLLKVDEKKVFLTLLKNNGELLQNKLVLETGLGKVKITRILLSLERKSLVVKERYGLTNRVKVR